MIWEIYLTLPIAEAAKAEDALEEVGAMAISFLADPEKSGLKTFQAWFEGSDQQRAAIDLKLRLLLAAMGLLSDVQMGWKSLIDRDWQEAWKKEYRPLPIGNRLLVLPTWLTVPEGNHRHVLRMDPEMAFGSGSHETTRGCLEALEYVADQPNGLGSVLDMGTGSGILAIGAVLLGARSVLATDNDPQAITTSQKNCLLNQVDTQVEIQFTADLPKQRFQTVVANILAPVLIEKSYEIAQSVASGGTLILAGILESQFEEVLQAYKKQELHQFKTTLLGEWAIITAQKGVL
ncbi:MAG: 50S ribosomal protein L11 methyltransferase [Magnetococcus sp. DMHC-6]